MARTLPDVSGDAAPTSSTWSEEAARRGRRRKGRLVTESSKQTKTPPCHYGNPILSAAGGRRVTTAMTAAWR